MELLLLQTWKRKLAFDWGAILFNRVPEEIHDINKLIYFARYERPNNSLISWFPAFFFSKRLQFVFSAKLKLSLPWRDRSRRKWVAMRHVNGRESSREIAIISNNEKRFRRFKQNCALFYVTTGPAETSLPCSAIMPHYKRQTSTRHHRKKVAAN